MWEKESLFVDILSTDKFQSCRSTEQSYPLMAPKSDAVSLEKRNEGNRFFAEQEWLLAMEKYNESLCFAEHGSENLSLAYANRSACFLRLKQFSECLVDIELAGKIGYPKKLLPKLEQRKLACLKGEREQPKDEYYKLCAEPNKNFPCMANVVKIERKANGEYCVIAKRDLSIFEAVMIEKPIFKYLYGKHGTRCNICLIDKANLMPCDKCTGALFCGDECKNHFLHEHECGIQFCDDEQRNSHVLNGVRALLLTIDLFDSADEMTEFVEKATKGNPNGPPPPMKDEKSQYAAFLQYPIDSKFADTHKCCDIVFHTYQLIMRNSKISNMFKLEKHRRFLMHLISHHACIMDRNLLRSGGKAKEAPDNYYSYLTPMTQFFKKVYSPNLLRFEIKQNMVYVTSRMIKKGEELTIEFLFLRDYEAYDRQRKATTKKEHQTSEQEKLSYSFMKFESNCKPNCKCTRCKCPSNEQLNSDPDLQYLLSHGSNIDPNNRDFLQDLVEKVDAFHKKNGPGVLFLGKPK